MESIFVTPAVEALPNPRVAIFFVIHHSNTVKIYQITIKYTKWPKNIPNGRNIPNAL
jgi:hypothetical protein